MPGQLLTLASWYCERNCEMHLLLNWFFIFTCIEIDWYGILGVDTDMLAMHGLTADTDISKIIKSW